MYHYVINCPYRHSDNIPEGPASYTLISCGLGLYKKGIKCETCRHNIPEGSVMQNNMQREIEGVMANKNSINNIDPNSIEFKLEKSDRKSPEDIQYDELKERITEELNDKIRQETDSLESTTTNDRSIVYVDGVMKYLISYETKYGIPSTPADLKRVAYHFNKDWAIGGPEISKKLARWINNALDMHETSDAEACISSDDPVNHPSHYTQGSIECIDAIETSMSKEAFVGYLKGNFMKYVWRYKHKNNPVEDLKKANWYLNKLIEVENNG